jgi:hypothetical protein
MEILLPLLKSPWLLGNSEVGFPSRLSTPYPTARGKPYTSEQRQKLKSEFYAYFFLPLLRATGSGIRLSGFGSWI